jgi:predicted Zn-dependent protease
VASAAVDGYGPEGEREADAAGMRRVAAAGYDPSEAPKVFRLLAGDGADRGALLEIGFYGSRERMAERVGVAREQLGATREARSIAGDGAVSGEFERRMRPVVRDNAALDVRAGRFALARRQLDRVLASAPDDPVAQLYYGELHRLQSQQASGPARTDGVRKALERYERAVELDRGYAEPFRQLALLHYQEHDVVKARAALERYLALKPNAPDAQRVREYLAILPN